MGRQREPGGECWLAPRMLEVTRAGAAPGYRGSRSGEPAGGGLRLSPRLASALGAGRPPGPLGRVRLRWVTRRLFKQEAFQKGAGRESCINTNDKTAWHFHFLTVWADFIFHARVNEMNLLRRSNTSLPGRVLGVRAAVVSTPGLGSLWGAYGLA